MLAKPFSKWLSFRKAKVVRHPKTDKSKGYAFVSFLEPEEALQALVEMNGKYIGNKPITLKKSKWGDRQAADTNEALKRFKIANNAKNKKHHTGFSTG